MTIKLNNPNDPNHFAQVRTSKQHIQVYYNGECLADTYRPLILTENGRALYDSVYYIPLDDLTIDLQALPFKQTSCPIKGNASYLLAPDGKELAWTYTQPKHEATILKGYVGFDLHLVDLHLLAE